MHNRPLLIIRGIFFILLFSADLLWAQNYNFTNYNLKEGLPQSQVSVIFQATDRTLWLGSFGGISNFDGLNFKSYSKADGLLSNNVSCIAEDRHNRIWVGTDNGINLIGNGRIKKIVEGTDVYSLQIDPEGTVWGLSSRKLFKLQNNKLVFVTLVEGETVTCLSRDKQGNLYAFVRNTGLFKLSKNNWKLFSVFPAGIANNYVVKIHFEDKNPNKIYIATLRKGIFVYENGKVIPFFADKNIEGYFDIAQDAKGNLWVATPKGVFLVSPQKQFIVFNEQNGLRANKINVVFKDIEDNIWISSFGDGIFRYEGNAFIKFDRFKGQDLSYPVSGMAIDKHQNLWVSTFNKGLYTFNGNELKREEIPLFKDKNIYFVSADREKNVLISVQNNGLWKSEKNQFKQVPFTAGTNISAVIQDELGHFYLGEIASVTYLGESKIEKIAGFKGWVSCLYFYKKDSVILGTSSGAYLIKNQKIDHTFKISALNNAYVVGVLKHNGLLLFSTLGDGMISFDPKTGRTRRYLVSDGLNSNDIYSFILDQQGILWVGTGRGINKLKFNSSKQEYEVLKGKSLIIECNQNAILNYGGNVLVGTTRGVILCNTNQLKEKAKAPSILLQTINIYDKVDKKRDTSIALTPKAKKSIVLRFSQNHISINYKGIFLSSPEDVVYRYYLSGLDMDFEKPVTSTEAEYSALSPGSYTFKVYAEVNGERSPIQELAFIIKSPFYATLWFKILMSVTLILVIWILIYMILKRKELVRKQREKIKQEEQAKIRKQTAEDFHDDIGNKLTRINVLSEILEKKIDKQKPEQRELVRMIKENADLLYTGTKDILWALDPKSDNLYEIMQHIRHFGVDLFQNTGIGFQMEDIAGSYRKWQMSMEQNRNLTLIFKEVLTNILKHAQAKNVAVAVLEDGNKAIKIRIEDDGVGFDLNSIKHGQGLKNIKNRCERIKAKFDIETASGVGTSILISDIKSLQHLNYKS